MTDNLIKFRDLMVEAAGEFAASLGLNPVLGQLYSLLYFSPNPLSLDEMTELIKMSKGNISVNIRVLENWDAVRKVWVKGSRKDYYQANRDLVGIVLNRLKIGLTTRLNKAAGLLNQAEALLIKANNDSTKKVYQQRFNEIKKLHTKLTRLLRIFSPGLIKRLISSK